MSKDPKDIEERPPVGMPDDLPPIDRAMLLALSHRQGDSTPLSLDQERLLDSWIGGRLPPIDGDRAAELTKHNRFAAERILEGRLISAANEGPDVPSTLAARVLRASRPHNERAADYVPERRLIAAGPSVLSALAAAPPPPKTATGGIFNLRWPSLSRWQWSGLGAAVAATAVIAVFSFQVWQEQKPAFGIQDRQAQTQPDQSFQIAMVTIEDRSVLFEGARRTRGPRESGAIQSQAPSPYASASPPREAGVIQPQAPSPYASASPAREAVVIQPQAPSPYASVSEKHAEGRFRDINIPTALLRNAITSASNNKGGVERSQLMNYLRAQNDAFDARARILIDSALAESLSGKPDGDSIPVRVYDLDDLRAVPIRRQIKPLQTDAHFILLTLKQ